MATSGPRLPPIVSAHRRGPGPGRRIVVAVAARREARQLPLRRRIAVTEQLGRLLESGMPLTLALAEVEAGARGRLRLVLGALHRHVESGSPLSEAGAAARALLGDNGRGLVAAGERTGTLGSVLARLAARGRRTRLLYRQLWIGILYPLFLLVSSGFLMPLPLLFTSGTAGYVGAVAASLARIGACIAGAALLPSVLDAVGLTPALRRLGWHLPGVAWLYRRHVASDAAWALSTALGSGLGLPEALSITAGATGDPTVARRLRDVGTATAGGAGFTDALGRSGLLPDPSVLALAGAERSGTLAGTLERVSEDLARDVLDLLTVLSRVFAILLLVGVSLAVGLRVLGAARGLLPGGGGELDQIDRLIRTEGPKVLPLH